MNGIENCEAYLRARTGNYGQRSERYLQASRELRGMGLNDDHLLCDVGAGWTEFDYHLRTRWGWRGRYWPVDCAIDGTDLNEWMPPRRCDFMVGLEIAEHMRNPAHLLLKLINNADEGVVVTVPNPRVVDVLEIDGDHKSVVTQQMLEEIGFDVMERSCYGKPNDALLGMWRRG